MLHIITASPYRNSALRECLAIADPADTLLLLGDGAYATTLAPEEFAGRTVVVLQAHASARGIPETAWATYIDHAGMVDLTDHLHPIQTWY